MPVIWKAAARLANCVNGYANFRTLILVNVYFQSEELDILDLCILSPLYKTHYQWENSKL